MCSTGIECRRCGIFVSVAAIGTGTAVLAVVAEVVSNPLLAATVALFIAAAVTGVLLTARRLSRWLLRVLGRLVVPVGYERLGEAEPVSAPEPVPALESHAPLAIEPPRTLVAGAVIDDPAFVVVNGTKYAVLSKD